MKQKVRALKQELVLNEAAKYFEEVGFEAVTMAELAKKCGISVGALYKLFESKEALFYTYVEHQINALYKEIVETSRYVDNVHEKLQIVVEKKFETFCSKSKIIFDPIAGDPLFFTKLSKKRENPAHIIYDYTAELFEALSHEVTLKVGNNVQLSYLFHNFLLGFIEHWLHAGGDLRKESSIALDLFLNGLIKEQ